MCLKPTELRVLNACRANCTNEKLGKRERKWRMRLRILQQSHCCCFCQQFDMDHLHLITSNRKRFQVVFKTAKNIWEKTVKICELQQLGLLHCVSGGRMTHQSNQQT